MLSFFIAFFLNVAIISITLGGVFYERRYIIEVEKRIENRFH